MADGTRTHPPVDDALRATIPDSRRRRQQNLSMTRQSRRTAGAMLVAAAGSLLAPARPRQSAPAQPSAATSLLIVTIDTLRADRVGVYGGHVDTPNIDRLPPGGARAPPAARPV